MSVTPNLSMIVLPESGSNAFMYYNSNQALVDCLLQGSVINRTTATPPGSPAEGDRYLIAASATGAWATHDGQFTFLLNGAWYFATPKVGWSLWVAAENREIIYDGTTWRLVGDIITSVIASGSAVSLTTATAANVTSISLPAGDWDVSGVVDFHPGSTTTTTYLQGGISSTSATLGAQDSFFSDTHAIATTSIDAAKVVPTVRLSLSTTTTVYLVAKAGFATSTLTAYGTIRASRVK